MTTWYKKAQDDIIGRPDFTSVDVRRLSGIFEDFQDLSTAALEEMGQWIDKGETDITLEEATKRLSYYMARMGIE